MKLLKFDCIDSTNTYGKSNFDKLDDKTLILTDKQTHGKGRFDRVWLSENSENIYLSIVLKPEKTEHIQNLTQYMSVTASKVIEAYGLKPQIKWPNDVLINGKKICGILCEGILKDNKLTGAVLGVGINLNMDEESFLKIGRPATSISIETGCKTDKEVFLQNLLDTFFKDYESSIQHGFEYFKKDYLKYINFLGKTVYIQQRDRDIKQEYKAQNIDNNGNLVVKDTNNHEKIIYSGDLIY